MPYLSIQSNQSLEGKKEQDVLLQLSHACAEMLGKPESYMMVSLQLGTPMSFAGSTDPAAFVQLHSLGLPEQESKSYSSQICDWVSNHLGVPTNRIYIHFSSPERHLWGWNNSTF